MRKSNWIISPWIGVKIKNMWNHHLLLMDTKKNAPPRMMSIPLFIGCFNHPKRWLFFDFFQPSTVVNSYGPTIPTHALMTPTNKHLLCPTSHDSWGLEKQPKLQTFQQKIPSCMVYLPTFTIKKIIIHVGKYTSPMDCMGKCLFFGRHSMFWFGATHSIHVYIFICMFWLLRILRSVGKYHTWILWARFFVANICENFLVLLLKIRKTYLFSGW